MVISFSDIWRHIVSENDLSQRLDTYLVQVKPELSRTQLKKLIEAEQVLVNRVSVKSSHKIKVGDVIELRIPPVQILESKPEAIELPILYEDDCLAVINKPQELVVHASAGHSEHTLVNALLYHLKDLSQIGGVLRPGIVHRLDKGTSGVMVIAKNNAAHLNLSQQFKDRKIEKTYVALAYGHFRQKEGVIENRLGRSKINRKKISSKTQQGREAITYYRLLKTSGVLNYVEVKPKTGRTHQIRVHLTEAGHPIVGDPLYGGKQWVQHLEASIQERVTALNHQLLHALKLRFQHPLTQEWLEFVAPLPADFQQILEYLP